MKGENMFLDDNIIRNFREVLNSSSLFKENKEYVNQFNLYCAVCDRIDDSIKYLNENCDIPTQDHDFLVFMMYSCIIIDAVYNLFDSVKMRDEYNSYDKKQIFAPYCKEYPLELSEEQCPSDNDFFKYFRSLSFAHPFETSRAKFLKDKERQYSPWVIVHNPIYDIMCSEESVGVRIYSNKCDEIKDLKIPFRAVKDYVASRYALISVITEKLNAIISQCNEKWKMHKVNREGEIESVLSCIIDILKERFITNFIYEDFDELLGYISTKCTCSKNQWLIEEYKNDIEDILQNLCESIDNLDYDKADELLTPFISPHVRKMHASASYELEKIYCYLNDDVYSEDHDWGLRNADAFYNSFAHKWVEIDLLSMSDDEIKLLINLSLYKEAKNEGNR